MGKTKLGGRKILKLRDAIRLTQDEIIRLKVGDKVWYSNLLVIPRGWDGELKYGKINEVIAVSNGRRRIIAGDFGESVGRIQCFSIGCWQVSPVNVFKPKKDLDRIPGSGISPRYNAALYQYLLELRGNWLEECFFDAIIWAFSEAALVELDSLALSRYLEIPPDHFDYEKARLLAVRQGQEALFIKFDVAMAAIEVGGRKISDKEREEVLSLHGKILYIFMNNDEIGTQKKDYREKI